ncbi:somatostatin receptor type 4-like [Coccinella septempunctata]|uniref:somatostatin receptor type 4-like n=1 Tax=Coccinella septempunctata TaxID=41139 RepID=UPI001D066851|nr:somatostatin receptor type 4-like [Coccinella septempunctata]
MDFEPIANISANETFEPDENYRYERENILDIPILLAATAGIVADLIIVFTILRNKELRTRSNIYIVNLCICNIFYLFFTPLILNLFSAAEKLHASTICFSDELFFLFMLGNYVFICILLSDWYIVTYKSLNASARCRASYKLVISTVWATLFVLLITIFLQCTSGISLFLFIALLAIIFYFCSFIFVAVIFVMKVINERTTSVVEAKSNTELLYVMSYFFCWLPNWMYIFVSVFAKIITRAAFLGLCTFMLGYLHSIILLYLMYGRNEKFRIAMRKWMFNEEVRNVEEDSYKDDEHFTTLL